MYKIGLIQINPASWKWYVMHSNDQEVMENIIWRGDGSGVRDCLRQVRQHTGKDKIGEVFMDRRMGWN